MPRADDTVLISYAVTGLLLVGCAILPTPPILVRLGWAIAGTGLVSCAVWPVITRDGYAVDNRLPLVLLPFLTIAYAAHVLRGYAQRRASAVFVVAPPAELMAAPVAVPADPWEALYASVAARQELPNWKARLAPPAALPPAVPASVMTRRTMDSAILGLPSVPRGRAGGYEGRYQGRRRARD
jgi:hypothetical protein